MTETATTTPRLSKQLEAVKNLMADRVWRTLPDIQSAIPLEASTQSISARLRDLRKKKFGNFLVEKRSTGSEGLYEYRLDMGQFNPEPTQMPAPTSKTFDGDAVFRAAEELVERAQACSLDFVAGDAEAARAQDLTAKVITDIVALVKEHSA